MDDVFAWMSTGNGRMTGFVLRHRPQRGNFRMSKLRQPHRLRLSTAAFMPPAHRRPLER